MKVRVGVLGLGGAGRAHVQRFLRNPFVGHVFGLDLRPIDIEGCTVCKDRDEFFDSIDIVSICTPDHEHCANIIEALGRGKHVLVEKPMVMSSEEAERVVQEADKHPNLIVAVHHQMRFNPAFERAKELRKKGTLGSIFSVDAQYWHDMRIRDTQFDDWRIEHGQSLLFGAASHPLDMVLDIVDSPVRDFQLYCNKIGYPDSQYEYTAVQLLLQFRDGTISKPIVRGKNHLKNLEKPLLGGSCSSALISISFPQYALIPGIWPAPTTATIFSPEAALILLAKYWSLSSIRMSRKTGRDFPISDISASSTSCCFIFSISSSVISSIFPMDKSS